MTDSEQLLSFFSNSFFSPSTTIGSVLRSPLLCQLAGSSAFNLNLPTSDKDYFGVFLFTANASLSSGSLISVPFSVDGHQPEDHQLYELEFYLQLLMKGNPKVIEPIFTDKLCYRSREYLSLFLLSVPLSIPCFLNSTFTLFVLASSLSSPLLYHSLSPFSPSSLQPSSIHFPL